MQVTRHLLPSTALVLSVALTTAAAPQTPPKQAVAKGTSSQLKVTVNAVAVATKFVAYLGGRTNISPPDTVRGGERSEEHTSELQSRLHLVCRLLLEKKKQHTAALQRVTRHRV